MHRSRPPRWGGGGVSGGRLILIAKVGVGIGGVVPIPLFGTLIKTSVNLDSLGQLPTRSAHLVH